YALKACLSGVQHGERRLRTPDLPVREQEAEQARKRLAEVEAALEQFEPLAFTGQLALLEPEPAFGSRVLKLLKRAAVRPYAPGKARGEREDAGDLERLPNFTPSYLAWSNCPNTDVLAYRPGLEGSFHIWLSWGCGSSAHAP